MHTPNRPQTHDAMAMNATLGWLLRLFMLACLLVLTVDASWAQQTDPSLETQVKAAYLLKFGSYVEWPSRAFDTPNARLVIGVLGAEALADGVSQAAVGRSINGRPIEVRRLHHSDALTGLHILFVARSERAHMVELQPSIKGLPLLIVSDDEDLPGHTINFVVVDDRIRFDIVLPPSDAAGLKISSRLLSVARKVTTRPAS